jgi:hypothetical protein
MQKIRTFIEDALAAQPSTVEEVEAGRCSDVTKALYIAGVPGTGKTACVMEVVESLRQCPATPDFRFVYINALYLPTPAQFHSKLFEKIKGMILLESHSASIASLCMHPMGFLRAAFRPSTPRIFSICTLSTPLYIFVADVSKSSTSLNLSHGLQGAVLVLLLQRLGLKSSLATKSRTLAQQFWSSMR